MKVLFFMGGAPHYFVKVLNQLNKTLEVNLVVPKDSSLTIGSGVHLKDDKAEFKIHKLQEKMAWYGKAYFKEVKSVIKTVNPDMVILSWPYYLQLIFNLPILFYLKSKKIKIIVREIPFKVPSNHISFQDFKKTALISTKNEKIYNSKFIFKLHQMVFKLIYKYIANGALCYTDEGFEILGSYGLDKNKIFTTLNSPDTNDLKKAIEELKSENLNRKTNRILHVGRLVYWKRVDLLIESIDILKTQYPDIELIIVGKGEEEDNLKKLVTQKELGQYVKFKGAIYDEKDLCRVFQESDVYVLAGMGGLSLNEAMCNSLPIICSVCDGTEKHLVKDGINGFYFKADDLNSLTDKINLVLSNSELKSQMGKKSLEIIDNEVNINEVVKRYINALNALKNAS